MLQLFIYFIQVFTIKNKPKIEVTVSMHFGFWQFLNMIYIKKWDFFYPTVQLEKKKLL